MKNIISRCLPLLDFLLLPFVFPSSWLLKGIRHIGIQKFPRCKSVFIKVGVFPIQNHYYEPQFDHPVETFSGKRALPGLDWNVSHQIQVLSSFTYSYEFSSMLEEKSDTRNFHFGNGSFESGDAEYWYQLIRSVKPKTIVEIGSGNSTLIADMAIRKNREQASDYECDHICIEPYEMKWLEKLNASTIRQRVEDIELDFFTNLEENDILFIDSSHIIRPQGDVLYEYLEILPSLKKGVIVHIHDIFSPRNYPREWLQDEVKFWNEQYLLEAFLCHNKEWKVIGALNYLHHNHYKKLKEVAPFLTPNREPGSFYIQKTA